MLWAPLASKTSEKYAKYFKFCGQFCITDGNEPYDPDEDDQHFEFCDGALPLGLEPSESVISGFLGFSILLNIIGCKVLPVATP